jgi:hypothetical protein
MPTSLSISSDPPCSSTSALVIVGLIDLGAPVEQCCDRSGIAIPNSVVEFTSSHHGRKRDQAYKSCQK